MDVIWHALKKISNSDLLSQIHILIVTVTVTFHKKV